MLDSAFITPIHCNSAGSWKELHAYETPTPTKETSAVISHIEPIILIQQQEKKKRACLWVITKTIHSFSPPRISVTSLK